MRLKYKIDNLGLIKTVDGVTPCIVFTSTFEPKNEAAIKIRFIFSCDNKLQVSNLFLFLSSLSSSKSNICFWGSFPILIEDKGVYSVKVLSSFNNFISKNSHSFNEMKVKENKKELHEFKTTF